MVGLAGVVLRRHVHEAAATSARGQASPLLDDDPQPRPAARASSPALSVFNSVGFYLMFVYIVSWLQFADNIAPAHGAGHQFDQHGADAAGHGR